MADSTPRSRVKALGVKEKETSSSATVYLDASIDWLKSKGKKVVNWISNPVATAVSLKDGVSSLLKKITGTLSGIAKDVKQVASELKQYRELLSPLNVVKSVVRWFQQAKQTANNFIGTVIKVQGKIVGQLKTVEGQALATFVGVAGTVLAGGWLLGLPTEALQLTLRGAQFFYTHNWNRTDADYEKDIDGQIANLYGSAGEALGTGLASFVTGGVFRLPRVQINVTKISILWRALNEEAREELMVNLKGLARTAYRGALKILFSVFYPQVRKMVKKFVNDNPNSPLLKLIPGGKKTIDQWGVGPAWALGENYVNKKIEALQESDDENKKNLGRLLENFVDSFGDGLQDFLPELIRQPIH